MQQILGSLTTDVTVTQPSQAHTFGGQYPGELALLNRGMIGVLRSQDQLLLVILISDDIATNQAAMTNLLESIRMPAEANQPAPLPTQATVPTAQPPQPQPTQSSGDTAQTYRSSDNQVSLVLPGPGTVLDHMADQNILAYGENDAAAQSRLYSVNPDLAPQTPISGTGGVIILYPMSRFQIDPQNPDLSGLMERALGGLTGYTVEQTAQPLAGGGLYAVIASGTERGYLALIPFGDQIAYVTATTTPDRFGSDNEVLLLNIVKSVRVPAASEKGGLGGLGGLDATPEATPEAQSGLSGL